MMPPLILLFAGGASQGGEYVGSVYSLSDSGWILRTSLNHPRAKHACAVVGKDMFIMGGFDG